jgi:hypothetical protein
MNQLAIQHCHPQQSLQTLIEVVAWADREKAVN